MPQRLIIRGSRASTANSAGGGGVSPSADHATPMIDGDRSATDVSIEPKSGGTPLGRSRVHAFVNEVAVSILAPREGSIAEQIERKAWRPDGPSTYCGRCGHRVGPNEATDAGCARCRGSALAYDAAVRLGTYDGALARWVLELKFRRRLAVATELGRRLGEAVAERLDTSGLTGPRVVTPIPTPRRRRMQRGIDHTNQLAKEVARAMRTPVVRALRARHHEPQHLLEPTARQRNLLDRYALARGSRRRLCGATVVLVDDVMTSGSTARAAALALTGRADMRFRRATDGPGVVVLAVLAVAEGAGGGG